MKELFRLIAQTTAIWFSAMEPVAALLTMMIFKLNIYGMGTMANLLLCFMPSLNPLCTLLLVSRLRDRAFQLFCFWKCDKIQTDLVVTHKQALNSK